MLNRETKRLVYIGSDHAGFEMKEQIKTHLEKDYELTDLGCFSEEPCDYPEIAREVGEKVLEHEKSAGIVLCGSGIGMSIAVNKLKGIRGALAMNEKMAEMSRRHNDANVLALGARENDFETNKKIVDTFLNTDFEQEEKRHARRVRKLNSM
jgi:ribose 5-phosphate isomerase B